MAGPQRPRAGGLKSVRQWLPVAAAVTFLNVYWGWARERQLRAYDSALQRRAGELDTLEEELLRRSRSGDAPKCEPCSCPACPTCQCKQPAAAAPQPQPQPQGRLRVPCPGSCRGRGSCDSSAGVCKCAHGWAGKDCGVSATAALDEAVTVLLPSASYSAADRKEWLRRLRRQHRGLRVVATEGDDLPATDPSLMTVPRPRERTLGAELDDLFRKSRSDFVMVVVDSNGVGEESNLTLGVDMLRTTDADIVGGLEVLPDGLLTTPCWELVHQRWHLRHRRSPLGYLRHEKFVMYCDRSSNTFLAASKSLQTLGGFNRTHSGMAVVDMYTRVLERNKGILVSAKEDAALKALAAAAPTRLPGWMLVGTVSEMLLPTRRLITEKLTSSFAEQHQIEAYWTKDGELAAPGVVCIKTGGNLQHSVDGRYSPLCHRYTRQRDFVAMHDLWTDTSFAPPAGIADPSTLKYAVSVHHGNLFGAMRLGSELLWETDGDLDFVSFNMSNLQLQDRARALAEELRRRGYGVKVPHPAKPWYINVLRNKSDFQISLRSTKDPRTAGRPPHVHTVSVQYQGRRVFVNGFANPWKGIRADPGHDYREHYLAQQGWVLHFTDESVHCKDPKHNACLPPCNSWEWRLDHNYCTDSIEPTYRDPYLWFDKKDAANVLWRKQLDTFR